MLLEFSVANFRSFKDRATLSLLADENEAEHPENTSTAPDGARLLRIAAIYGANASGKSNLIQAFLFVKRFVQDSFREAQAGEPIPVRQFRLNPGMKSRPSEFEVVFYQNGVRYRYGFAVNERHVLEEWLFHGSGPAEAQLFLRGAAEDSSIQVSPAFGPPPLFRTRENALFLSTAAQNSSEKELAAQVVSWFRKLGVMSGLSEAGYGENSLRRLTDPERKALVLDLAREADLTLADILVKLRDPEGSEWPGSSSSSDRPRRASVDVTTQRMAFDDEGQPAGLVPFSWQEESDGTRKFIALSVPLIDVLVRGSVLVADELDARFHPLLTRALIKLFKDQTNIADAQLIFATHDTNLLDSELLRRDQIWFTEKDPRSSTALYSLAEYDVPAKADLEQDYIEGRYGAIPFLGNLTFPARGEGKP